MPTYFFDIHDGEFALRDEFGIELESLREAAEQAAALLPDIARDALPGMTSRDFAVSVRDGAGTVVHRAALLFRAQWLPGSDAPAPARRGATLAVVSSRKAVASGGFGAGRSRGARAEPIAPLPRAGLPDEAPEAGRTWRVSADI